MWCVSQQCGDLMTCFRSCDNCFRKTWCVRQQCDDLMTCFRNCGNCFRKTWWWRVRQQCHDLMTCFRSCGNCFRKTWWWRVRQQCDDLMTCFRSCGNCFRKTWCVRQQSDDLMTCFRNCENCWRRRSWLGFQSWSLPTSRIWSTPALPMRLPTGSTSTPSGTESGGYSHAQLFPGRECGWVSSPWTVVMRSAGPLFWNEDWRPDAGSSAAETVADDGHWEDGHLPLRWKRTINRGKITADVNYLHVLGTPIKGNSSPCLRWQAWYHEVGLGTLEISGLWSVLLMG